MIFRTFIRSTKKFFALPDEIKQKYENPALAGQRGYIGKGKEHAKGRNTGDLKEFYHVGQEVADNDPIKEEYPENIWPDEVPEFKEIALGCLQSVGKCRKSYSARLSYLLRHGRNVFRCESSPRQQHSAPDPLLPDRRSG
jgi:isopenicillin N synthase-like dioxygenase